MDTTDDALLCPITLALFRDPVVAEDGHTYERTAIEEWIQRNGTSPMTRKPMSLEILIPNYAIKKVLGWQLSSCVFFENVLKHSRKF